MISYKKKIYDKTAYLKLIFKKKEDSINTLIFDLHLLEEKDINNKSLIENRRLVNDFIDEINNSFKLAIKETVIYNFKNNEDFRKSLNNWKKTNFKLNISDSLKLLLSLNFHVANSSNINSERLNDEIFELWEYSIYQQFIKFDLDVIKQEEPKKEKEKDGDKYSSTKQLNDQKLQIQIMILNSELKNLNNQLKKSKNKSKNKKNLKIKIAEKTLKLKELTSSAKKNILKIYY